MRTLSPYGDGLIVAAMAALAGVLLWRVGDVTLHDAVPVTLDLPDRVGLYEADDVRFCQSEACLRAWRLVELEGQRRCPACGGPLLDVALAERRILPRDTLIRRRQYRGPLGDAFAVTVVVSATEQRSLHRPQQCLPAQGMTIEAARILEVPLAPASLWRVKVLEARRGGRDPAAATAPRALFAYWFAGEGRETPYYLERLFWTARSRVLNREVHRWAYVTVTTPREPGPGRALDRLCAFLAALHPLLTPPEHDPQLHRAAGRSDRPATPVGRTK